MGGCSSSLPAVRVTITGVPGTLRLMAARFMPTDVWCLAFSLIGTATAGSAEFFGGRAGITVAIVIGSNDVSFTAHAGVFNGALLFDGCS